MSINLNKKTWIIHSDTSNMTEISVGDRVRLQLHDTNLWLSDNTLVSKNKSPELAVADASRDFIVYAYKMDDSEPLAKGQKIKNGMIIGLFCKNSNFLSVNKDGSLINNVSNNRFIIYTPDLIDGYAETAGGKLNPLYQSDASKFKNATITSGTAVNLYFYNESAYFNNENINDSRWLLALKDNTLKCCENTFDDDYRNVNYPFLLMSVKIHERLRYRKQRLIYCSDYCWDSSNSIRGSGNGDTLWRYYSPPDYATLGDTYIPSYANNDDIKRKFTLTFCKITNPGNADEPFCIKTTGLRQISQISFGRDNWDGGYTWNWTGYKGGGSFKADNGSYAGGSRIFDGVVPNTGKASNYEPLGSMWFWGDGNQAQNFINNSSNKDCPMWAINKKYLNVVPAKPEAVELQRFIENKNESGALKDYLFNTRGNWTDGLWDGGRLILASTNFDARGKWGGVDAYRNTVWSVASIHDRRIAVNDKNNVKNNTYGNWIWLQPQIGTWWDANDDQYNTPDLWWKGYKTFLLRPIETLVRSCYSTNDAGLFNVWEQNGPDPAQQTTFCSTVADSYCNPDKPGTDLTSNFCQKNYCNNNVSIRSEECFNWHKSFCNKKIKLPDGTFKFENYELYPDLCACHMIDEDFAFKACDDYTKSFGIQLSDYVRRLALGTAYNYNNSQLSEEKNKEIRAGQCQAPELYNSNTCYNGYLLRPLGRGRCGSLSDDCKQVVPRNRSNPFSIKPPKICMQDVSVDIQGKLGKLNINQNMECKSDTTAIQLGRRCITGSDTAIRKPDGTLDVQPTVVFSPSTGTEMDPDNGNMRFFKTIINDSPPNVDPFQCGFNGDKRYSSVFKKNLTTNTYEFSDMLDNGTRTITYKLDTTDIESPFESDIKQALRWFAERNPTINKDTLTQDSFVVKPDKTEAYIKVNYTDCIVKYVDDGACVLENGRWKQPKKRQYIQPINGGKACIIDNTPYSGDCSESHSCVINKVPSYDSNACNINTDGSITYNLEFPIISNYSGDGLNCKDVTDEFLSTYKKDKFGSIPPFTDVKDNKVIASYSCQTCPIEYEPQGECVFDESSKKYYITKTIKPLSVEELLSCTPEQKTKYDTKKTIKEECSANCEFKIIPPANAPIGLCNLGKKVTKFPVDSYEAPGGATCDIVSIQAIRNLSNLYNVPIDKFKYVSSRGVIEMTEECDMPQDCIINYDSASEGSCNGGIKYNTYDIISLEKAGGLSCTKLMMNHENITDDKKILLDSNNFKIKVEKSCPVTQVTIEKTKDEAGNTVTTVKDPSGSTTNIVKSPTGDTVVKETKPSGEKTTTITTTTPSGQKKTQVKKETPASSNNTTIIIIVIILLLLIIGAIIMLK